MQYLVICLIYIILEYIIVTMFALLDIKATKSNNILKFGGYVESFCASHFVDVS